MAIKIIQDPAEKRRALDELHALLLLRSKHVVQAYDIVHGKAGDLGIVEEFIDGEDLSESKYPRSSGDHYLKTIWQVASGIADIHSCGVIHRDIKPNNMKFDSEGIVKIFDFGLARDDGPDAETKGFRGTTGFAAPELYDFETVAFSKAVDVYSFGVTAFFLTCGNLPDELSSIPPKILPSNFFQSLPFSVPEEISLLLSSCVERYPSDRPSMDTVRDEIARHLLRDKHQALAVLNRKESYLNSNNRGVRLELPSVGKIQISYDGLRFKVTSAEGEVFVNNSLVVANSVLPGSCVVALGDSSRMASQRAFITFDVSNPEVVL